MTIVERIKYIAQEKGFKISYITSQLGLSHSYFSGVEAGRTTISPERLAKIASILGTTPEYLLGETDEKSAGSADETDKLALQFAEKLRDDPKFNELVSTLLQLPEDDYQKAREIALFLANRRKDEK